MSGAFDFYVDESLLRKLLNDEPETTANVETGVPVNGRPYVSNGNGNGHAASYAHPPQPVDLPVHVPAAAEIAPAKQVPAPEQTTDTQANSDPPVAQEPSTPISSFDSSSEETKTAPASLSWIEGDRLAAEQNYELAIEAYSRALDEVPAEAATLRYNVGVSLLHSGKPHEAVSELTKALEMAPESRGSHVALAHAQLEAGLLPEAASSFSSLLASSGGNSDGRLDASMGLLSTNLRSGNAAEAEQSCLRVLEIDANNEASLEILLTLRQSQGIAEAIEDAANRILAIRPDSLRGLEALIGLAIEKQNLDRAALLADSILSSTEASQSNLDSGLLLRFASIYQATGQFAKAAVAASRVLASSEPQSNDIQLEAGILLGESLHKLDRNPDAIVAFEHALEITPDDAVVLWNLALLYEQEGRLPQAADTLRKTMELQPDWAEEASIRLASVESAQGHYRETAAALEQCLSIRKEWPDALFQLGAVLYRLGETERAQEVMMRALHMKPEESAWVEELGRIAVEHNDALLALDCQEKLSESQRETPEMDYNLGVVLQMESELELAAKYYIRALEKKPDFGQALLNLGHALQGLGREAEARACWGKAILLDPTLAEGYFG